MLKAWLLIVGISIAALLAASCAVTPQGAATALAAQVATQASVAATQAVDAATQTASNVYTAATQSVATALAGGPINPIPGYTGRRLIIDTPTAVFIQQPNGYVIIVRKPPKNKYPNGDPMP